MSTFRNQDVSCKDVRVALSNGKIFARIWTPATGGQTAAAKGPIVLFHDSLGCVELWRSFPSRLCHRSGRIVIAYDRLGFGQSDPYPGRLPMEFIALEAGTGFAGLRQQLGFDHFTAFGHSVGGAMAFHCARSFEGACEAVITESAQAFVEGRTLDGIREAKADFGLPGQLARLEKYHGDKARWVLDAWTETWLSPAFADWSLRQVLPHVRVPLLAIHGDSDEYGSTRQPEFIAAMAGGSAEVQILEGIRHVPHRECEERVAVLVTAFISAACEG